MNISIKRFLNSRQLIVVAALIIYTGGVCAQVVAGNGSNQLKVNTFTLRNGMKVWINEDHSQPKVFGAVVVNQMSLII